MGRRRQQQVALALDVDGVALARLLVELGVALVAVLRELLGFRLELVGLREVARPLLEQPDPEPFGGARRQSGPSGFTSNPDSGQITVDFRGAAFFSGSAFTASAFFVGSTFFTTFFAGAFLAGAGAAAFFTGGLGALAAAFFATGTLAGAGAAAVDGLDAGFLAAGAEALALAALGATCFAAACLTAGGFLGDGGFAATGLALPLGTLFFDSAFAMAIPWERAPECSPGCRPLNTNVAGFVPGPRGHP